jgi:hypothetical protein
MQPPRGPPRVVRRYFSVLGKIPRVAISSRIALSRTRGMCSFSHWTSRGRSISRTASSRGDPDAARRAASASRGDVGFTGALSCTVKVSGGLEKGSAPLCCAGCGRGAPRKAMPGAPQCEPKLSSLALLSRPSAALGGSGSDVASAGSAFRDGSRMKSCRKTSSNRVGSGLLS